MNGISQQARKLNLKRRRHRDKSKLKLINGVWFAYSIRPDGYVQISSPTLAPSYLAFEHRYVWESKHGTLKDGYEIHHIDGNRQNNEIQNLECVTTAEHHARDRKVRNSMAEYLKSIGQFEQWQEKFNNGTI
jgi:hypothetical protein